jgi:hypothetical protein
MPLFLLFMGLLAIITAVKGNTADVAKQIQADFSGAGSFWYWIAAILILAVLGRALGVPNAAKMLIGLILAVYLLSQPGLWAKGVSALNVSAPGASTVATATPVAPLELTPGAPAATTPAPAPQTIWDQLAAPLPAAPPSPIPYAVGSPAGTGGAFLGNTIASGWTALKGIFQ